MDVGCQQQQQHEEAESAAIFTFPSYVTLLALSPSQEESKLCSPSSSHTSHPSRVESRRHGKEGREESPGYGKKQNVACDGAPQQQQQYLPSYVKHTPENAFHGVGNRVDGGTIPDVGASPSPDVSLVRQPPLDYVPPFRFALVEEGVYRGAYPVLRNFSFLLQLGLRTIVSLTPEEPTYDLACFAAASGITIHHIQAERFKGEAQLLPTDLNTAINTLIDMEKHPVYIHCLDGRHVTGLVLMGLRKLQQWDIIANHAEYIRFTGKVEDEVAFIADYTGPVMLPRRTSQWLFGGAWHDSHGRPRRLQTNIKLKFPSSSSQPSGDGAKSSAVGGAGSAGPTRGLLQNREGSLTAAAAAGSARSDRRGGYYATPASATTLSEAEAAAADLLIQDIAKRLPAAEWVRGRGDDSSSTHASQHYPSHHHHHHPYAHLYSDETAEDEVTAATSASGGGGGGGGRRSEAKSFGSSSGPANHLDDDDGVEGLYIDVNNIAPARAPVAVSTLSDEEERIRSLFEGMQRRIAKRQEEFEMQKRGGEGSSSSSGGGGGGGMQESQMVASPAGGAGVLRASNRQDSFLLSGETSAAGNYALDRKGDEVQQAPSTQWDVRSEDSAVSAATSFTAVMGGTAGGGGGVTGGRGGSERREECGRSSTGGGSGGEASTDIRTYSLRASYDTLLPLLLASHHSSTQGLAEERNPNVISPVMQGRMMAVMTSAAGTEASPSTPQSVALLSSLSPSMIAADRDWDWAAHQRYRGATAGPLGSGDGAGGAMTEGRDIGVGVGEGRRVGFGSTHSSGRSNNNSFFTETGTCHYTLGGGAEGGEQQALSNARGGGPRLSDVPFLEARRMATYSNKEGSGGVREGAEGSGKRLKRRYSL